MKKITVLLSVLLLAIVLVAPVSASADSGAGIKPDSFFYFFDTAFEKINLFFTFNPEKKAEKALGYAEERLAEAEESASENKPKAVEKAMRGYEEKISLATKESKEIKDTKKEEKLLNTISENAAKHQEILKNVLEKVPAEAKDAIRKAIEISEKGQNEAMKQFAELKKENTGLKNEIEKLREELKNKNKKIESGDKDKKEIEDKKSSEKDAKLEKLKNEVGELKREAEKRERKEIEEKNKESRTKQINQSKILTLPNGAIVEMDEEGNIVKIMKEALNEITVGTVSEVTKGKLAQTETLKITSINISSTNQKMTFDLVTNKLAKGTVFLTGNNFSQSYSLGSELSTRHLANFNNLNADSEYSYEVEIIANDEVVKNKGVFSTKPDIHIFDINNVKYNCKTREDGIYICIAELELKYQTGKDTNSIKRPKGVSVNASIPLLNFNQTVATDDGNYGGDSRIYAKFNIPIRRDGTYPVIFSADGAIHNYNLVVNTIDTRKDILCKENGAFCNSRDVAYIDMTPRIVKTQESKELQTDPQMVGRFRFEGIADSWVKSIDLDTDLPIGLGRNYGSVAGAYPSIGRVSLGSYYLSVANNIITIYTLEESSPGIYSVIIKDANIYGSDGAKKMVYGFPVAFTFEVK